MSEFCAFSISGPLTVNLECFLAAFDNRPSLLPHEHGIMPTTSQEGVVVERFCAWKWLVADEYL